MCKEAAVKQTFFLVHVFNKILIIFLAKLACLSLWTQCSSAHTCKEGQGQQRSYKAHLGVKKWVFGHLLHTYWGAGFWFSTTQQRAKAKQTWRALFQCQGEQQTANGEFLGQSICMGKCQWPGCLPCLGHCSGHTDSLLLLLQPSEQQFWQSQPTQGSLVRPLSLPASVLLSPCSPQQPCFSCLFLETIPGLSILWPLCKSLGTSAYLPIPPFFNFICKVCICCIRAFIYKQYSGHCHYFLA